MPTLSANLTEAIVTFVVINVVVAAILGGCSYLILLERKLSAWMQDRVGPNRNGPYGLFQPVADGLKFLFKEEVIPDHADKILFVLAPSISVFTTLLALAVVPFGPVEDAPWWFRFIIAPNIDIGVVFIFAITSLAVYGVILGGWASNNKYSALGALRASAQVISYEIPLGMSLVGVFLLAGTANLESILGQQAAAGISGWWVWTQPLACLIFCTASLAEANRLPFDLSECEQELVGGFHTEYSALKFGLFFLGEYTHVITSSFLVVVLFFGGWHFPWIATPESAYFGSVLVKLLVLLSKVMVVIGFVMMIRWTIPRFRFDQLMALAWKVLVPLALANVVVVMFALQFGWNRWWLTVASIALVVAAGLISTAITQADIQRRPVASSRPSQRRVAT
ncbi:MAG: NADH-quinone oxidoreductase subunit NuoH [Lacipirellulaceae bacterium]